MMFCAGAFFKDFADLPNFQSFQSAKSLVLNHDSTLIPDWRSGIESVFVYGRNHIRAIFLHFMPQQQAHEAIH
ncbi:MAG: hypothetical protein WAS33_22440, partial [Candidatus Promineifilaceae bacterium]